MTERELRLCLRQKGVSTGCQCFGSEVSSPGRSERTLFIALPSPVSLVSPGLRSRWLLSGYHCVQWEAPKLALSLTCDGAQAGSWCSFVIHSQASAGSFLTHDGTSDSTLEIFHSSACNLPPRRARRSGSSCRGPEFDTRTHAGWLPVTCNASFTGNPTPLFSTGACTHVHTPTHRHVRED